jgi:hypothetical protein
MGRKLFANSITQLPTQEGITPQGPMVQAAEPANKNEKLTVLFSLGLTPEAQADLEQKVAQGQRLSQKSKRSTFPVTRCLPPKGKKLSTSPGPAALPQCGQASAHCSTKRAPTPASFRFPPRTRSSTASSERTISATSILAATALFLPAQATISSPASRPQRQSPRSSCDDVAGLTPAYLSATGDPRRHTKHAAGYLSPQARLHDAHQSPSSATHVVRFNFRQSHPCCRISVSQRRVGE